MANTALTTFESIILGLLAAAEAELPVFIHSAKGIAVLNASEPLVNAAVAQATAATGQPSA